MLLNCREGTGAQCDNKNTAVTWSNGHADSVWKDLMVSLLQRN